MADGSTSPKRSQTNRTSSVQLDPISRSPSIRDTSVQTRDQYDSLMQHKTFEEAYSQFDLDQDWFKISFNDADDDYHRWIWSKGDQIWIDKPITIEPDENGTITTLDIEVNRLTDAEFREKYS